VTLFPGEENPELVLDSLWEDIMFWDQQALLLKACGEVQEAIHVVRESLGVYAAMSTYCTFGQLVEGV
jgi:hypothetical protein